MPVRCGTTARRSGSVALGARRDTRRSSHIPGSGRGPPRMRSSPPRAVAPTASSRSRRHTGFDRFELEVRNPPRPRLRGKPKRLPTSRSPHRRDNLAIRKQSPRSRSDLPDRGHRPTQAGRNRPGRCTLGDSFPPRPSGRTVRWIRATRTPCPRRSPASGRDRLHRRSSQNHRGASLRARSLQARRTPGCMTTGSEQRPRLMHPRLSRLATPHRQAASESLRTRRVWR